MTFLSVENIEKRFGGVQALAGVDFTVLPGEIHGLVGENGSGKSTLIKVIAGVYSPDRGRISIEGTPISSYSPLAAVRHGISVIYQDISLFPNMSVLENLYLGRVVGEGGIVVRPSRYRDRALATLDGLHAGIDPDDPVGELPIATQQLVAIARALMNDSRLLILDEPTTALTRHEIVRLFGVMRELKRRGISFIFISHKLSEIMEICDRVTVLRDGVVIGTKDCGEVDAEAIEAMMLGGSRRFAREAAGGRERGTELLRVEGLSKRNNFKDIGFRLYRGEVLGISGLLGSGRTELASALFGIAPADEGRIFLNGKRIRIRSVADGVRHGIAYVPEDRLLQGLVMDHSVANNVIAATLREYLNALGLLDAKKIARTVRKWIDALRIRTDTERTPARMLSGGNQQKVVLAKWLAMRPPVLILDGPTVGIDVGAKKGIYDTIRREADDGMGVILISDEIPELLANCDRILVMRNGRIVKEIDAASVDEGALQQIMEEEKRSVG